METRVADHEDRIRALERKAIETGYAIGANSRLLDSLLPKVDKLVTSDALATEIKNALRTNDNNLWSKREKYMGVWALIVTTISPIATTIIVTHSH